MKQFFFLIFTLLVGTSYADNIYLDELDTRFLLQDWGAPVVNQSIMRTPFQVAGKTFNRGIGTHSISRFLLNLEGKATAISGWVGADDRNDFTCNMEFKILADKKEVWSSGVVHKGMPAQAFRVSLKGVRKIALIVAEAGDGIMYDHADWLEVKIETSGKVTPEPVTPQNIVKEKYILTPQPGQSPKINSPKVFGARPGSPFIYNVATTGARPMKFSARSLPAGLILNEATGLITGTATQKGTYPIVVKAENSLGSDSITVRLEIGDKICLTPPMGWNSWNCWGLSVNEQKVKDAADVMNTYLINHGWTYVNIDDGWEAEKRDENGVLHGNAKFPDFKRLSDYVHSKGLKFGIYSSPGPTTCGGYQASYQHEKIDAETWAQWGVDYLKHDFCSYSQLTPSQTEAAIKAPYDVMRHALDGVDRDIVYCIGYGAPNVWNWAKAAGGNLWRTTRDITDEWNIVSAIGFFQDVCAEATAPGCYNDADMLVVGKLGLGWMDKVHDSYLTPDEQYSHVSLWCILSAPLLIGCDMSDMDDFTLNLLTNDEVLAVNQDPAVKPAHKILTQNGQIWWKPLEDGSFAVGFFNADPYFILWDQSQANKIQEKHYPMQLDVKQLGIEGKFKVRDLWRQQEVGEFKHAFRTNVPYHGVRFVKITPV
ncbi:MAG: NPCBM/NEW2 domain-containing protein [Dysgonamonadaceae bacterium]|jgi:alpha-galactosidase|nr:NPCBM/NEW2 domain-containing protein [Dysgonamonadaceae bacterium]